MDPQRWRRITDVFHRALPLDEPRRGSFLAAECGSDHDLRARVDALLAADRQAGEFGERPVAVSVTGDHAVAGTAIPEPAEEAPGPLQSQARHPFTWVVFGATVVAAAAFAYAGNRLVREGLGDPWFGWTDERRGAARYVAVVDANGPASNLLQPGDRLLAFNGVPPARNPGTRFLRLDVLAGQRYTVEIERQGQRRTYELTAAESVQVVPQRLAYFLIALTWCVVGLFVGWARPELAVARFAFAGAVMTGVSGYLAPVHQLGPMWQPLHVVMGYGFFSRFPLNRPPRGVWRFAFVFLCLAAAPAVAMSLALSGAIVQGGGAGATLFFTEHAGVFRVLRQPFTWLTYCSAFFLMPAVAAFNYRQLTDDDARRRVRWVVLGAIVFLVPQLYSAGVAAATSWLGPLPLPALAIELAMVSVVVPLSVAYAVVKHRVLDISVVVRRGLQYLLARRALQVAVAIPLVALVYTLVANRDRTVSDIVTGNRTYVYWLGAAAIGLRFRGPIRTWLDRRFFREAYDREQILLGLVDDAGRVDSVAALSDLVDAKLQLAFRPAQVYLWYRDPAERSAAFSSNPRLTPADFPGDGRWLSWLEAHGQPLDCPLPPEAGLSARDARWFATHQISLVIPIADSDERLAGVLLLGPKKSEEPYSGSDRGLLQAIARQAGVVRENVGLRARIGEETRIRHDVLARLDGTLANLLKECPACGACFDAGAGICANDGRALTLSLPVPRIIDGKYRIDRLIGKGGMGAVYEAVDLRLARTVAVKIMLGRMFGQPAAIRRFHREARAVAQLTHPNIVGVHDFGSLPGDGAYLVLERVHGVTLRQELARLRTLTPEQAVQWFEPLLDGLAAAHARGIVHRDLKPENVVGGHDDGRLAVKILDFGLAKFSTTNGGSSGTVTVEGMALGTLGYMSPEQLLGRDVDSRTDLFAVGVMLVESLTGRGPFERTTDAEATHAVLHDAYQPPAESPVLRSLDPIVQRCLAKEAADRISSADALQRELIPALRALC